VARKGGVEPPRFYPPVPNFHWKENQQLSAVCRDCDSAVFMRVSAVSSPTDTPFDCCFILSSAQQTLGK
jgi:hypothetical protein